MVVPPDECARGDPALVYGRAWSGRVVGDQPARRRRLPCDAARRRRRRRRGKHVGTRPDGSGRGQHRRRRHGARAHRRGVRAGAASSAGAGERPAPRCAARGGLLLGDGGGPPPRGATSPAPWRTRLGRAERRGLGGRAATSPLRGVPRAGGRRHRGRHGDWTPGAVVSTRCRQVADTDCRLRTLGGDASGVGWTCAAQHWAVRSVQRRCRPVEAMRAARGRRPGESLVTQDALTENCPAPDFPGRGTRHGTAAAQGSP